MRPIQIVMAAAVLAAWWRGSAAAQDIFVPPPRSQGDSIAPDAPQPPPAGSAPDTVRTLRGSELSGRVLGIDAEGQLLLADPLGEFSGQVTAPLRSLEQVRLAATESDDGPDALSIINGDSIVGTVVSIDPETVVMRTPSAGQVTIQRRVVSQVGFQGKGGRPALDSDFARGALGPWKPVNGQWSVQDGHLVCSSSGEYHVIAARVEQAEAVTVEAAIEGTSNDDPDMALAVLVDRPGSDAVGRNGVYAWFNDDEDRFHLGYSRDGDKNNVLDVNKDPSARTAILRLSYDPGTGKAAFWHNSVLMGEATIPRKFAAGQYVLFNTYYPCKVKYIRVSGGVLPPEGPRPAAAGDPAADAHVIEFSNHDRLTVRQVALAENNFTLTTAAVGQVRCEAEKILGVSFNAAGRQPVRRQINDVTVQTASSRFTLQFKSMDGEALVGHSDYMGEVKIQRSAIRSIRFNVYR